MPAHATSIIADEAHIDSTATIGPFCVIEGRVTIEAGVRLLGHNWVRGPVTLGAGTTLCPSAGVGLPPQHTARDHDAVAAGVRIGAGVVLREQTSVHAAMSADTPTTIGDRCYLMNSSHIAHDCRIGSGVIIASCVVVGGHAEINDNAFISGLVAVHQHTRVGRGAFVSGGIGFSLDLPPYCVCVDRNLMHGVNRVGMRRAGIDRREITAVAGAFRDTFRRSLSRELTLETLDERGETSACVREIADFVRGTKRGIMAGDGRPRSHVGGWLRKRFAALAGAPKDSGVNDTEHPA